MLAGAVAEDELVDPREGDELDAVGRDVDGLDDHVGAAGDRDLGDLGRGVGDGDGERVGWVL
jgi:hypothetical protein